MKITKDHPGLNRAENGDYILTGDLISDEGIEIDLDGCLVLLGSIRSRYNIKSKLGIRAGFGITAGDEITAGEGIASGEGIRAGTYIDCGKRIFAGTCVCDSDDYCDKTIKCAELRNGTIAYGNLVIIKRQS